MSPTIATRLASLITLALVTCLTLVAVLTWLGLWAKASKSSVAYSVPAMPAKLSAPLLDGNQQNAAIAYNSFNNEYLVVWEDDTNGTNVYNIYAQRVSVAGALLGYKVAISTAAGDQRNAAVAYNSTSNEYLVVWEDTRNGSGQNDVFGQRVSGAGALLGSNFGISGDPNLQLAPAVAYNSTSNEYLVVWEDTRNIGTGGWDVYGQRVSAAGALLSINFAISTATGDQRYAAVAYNSANNEDLVVWYDTRNGGMPGGDIFGQRVSAAGALLGSNFAISIAVGDQYYPAVAYNSTGNEYLVVWEDRRNGASNLDIYGQRVSAAGALLGSDFAISSATSNQDFPVLAYNNANNEYLVVWYDARTFSTNHYDVYGQRVSGAGTLLGSNFGISATTAVERSPAIARSSANNECLVVWHHFISGPYVDIYGQRVSGAGALLGSIFNITLEQATPTTTPSATPSATATRTLTATATRTSTSTTTATRTRTATQTSTSTSTATSTPTNTPVSGGIINGHLTWQGIVQPDSRNTGITATLSLCVGGITQTFNIATDANGFFTVTTGLGDGAYNWRTKGQINLANAGSLTIAGGIGNVEMGTLQAGDCNNDNVATVVDFNTMKSTFGRSSGDIGYDDRADFNRDTIVTVTDFNLLKNSFGRSGAALTCP